MQKRRALGVIRLSELVDETTSPERQEQIIQARADQRGSQIIGWARDLDVSASKFPPTKRPDLAKWLDRPGEYDEVIFWRIDRFVRSPADLTDMIRWSRAHGKGLLSATESFDLDEPRGEAMAYLAAIFAGMETKATSERVTGAHEYLRNHRRWGGGPPPFGYRVVPNPDGPGYVLEIDQETAEIIREAIHRVSSGESINSVVADFNRRMLLSPRDYARISAGKPRRCECGHETHDDGCGHCPCAEYRERHAPWQASSMNKILHSRALTGHVIHEKSPVPGKDGMPMTRAEPLISAYDWDRLQRALDAGSRTRLRTQAASELLNIAFCGECGKPLYKWVKTNRHGKTYAYYRCKNNYQRVDQLTRCWAKSMKCADLDTLVHGALLREVGWAEVVEERAVKGDNHEAAIRAVGAQIAELTTERYVKDIVRPGSDQMLAALQAEHARLSELEAEPDTIEPVPTGQTFRQRWESLDGPARRRWLIDAGVRAHALRGEGYPEIAAEPGPVTTPGIPRVIYENQDDLWVVIELGGLAKLLERMAK